MDVALEIQEVETASDDKPLNKSNLSVPNGYKEIRQGGPDRSSVFIILFRESPILPT